MNVAKMSKLSCPFISQKHSTDAVTQTTFDLWDIVRSLEYLIAQ